LFYQTVKEKFQEKNEKHHSVKELVNELKAIEAAQLLEGLLRLPTTMMVKVITLQTTNYLVYFAAAEILGPACVEEFVGITRSFPDFKLCYECSHIK
jgi:hypothetical protein